MLHGYQFLALQPGMKLLVVLAVVWTMVWKGIALWKAGRRNDLAWFVVMFIVNTLGILEIVYIFGFANRKPESHHM